MAKAEQANDYVKEREALVARLRSQGHVKTPLVEEAMRRVPRERFIPTYLTHRAYDDEPLSIGMEQTISAPHMVAIMTEALELSPGMRVLEVGTGSGYQAAVLGAIVGPQGHVVSVERVPVLADRARLALRSVEAHNVEVRVGDGSMGFPMRAPYHRVVVTAAAPDVPPPLLEQLRPDGLLLLPIGTATCELARVRIAASGPERESLGACAFVPLLGAYGQGSRRFAK